MAHKSPLNICLTLTVAPASGRGLRSRRSEENQLAILEGRDRELSKRLHRRQQGGQMALFLEEHGNGGRRNAHLPTVQDEFIEKRGGGGLGVARQVGRQ